MRWDSFVYFFLVGGILFIIGFWLTWRSGDHSWKRKEDRLCAIFLIVGVLFYFIGYLLWQLYAMGVI